MAGRQRFGNLTRNERYRRRLNAFVSEDDEAANVTLLIDFENGSDAGQDATDISANAHTITWNNGAVITDAVSAYSAQQSLDATTAGGADWIEVTETADGSAGRTGPTDFGDGDFTVEFHFRAATSAGADQLFQTAPTEEFHCGVLMSNNNLFIEYSSDGTTPIQTDSGHNALDATWHHIALVRNGNDLDLYMDGVKGSTTVDVTGVTLHALTTAAKCRFGGNATGLSGSEGHFDNIRITKGVARYTGNFTAPTERYPAVVA